MQLMIDTEITGCLSIMEYFPAGLPRMIGAHKILDVLVHEEDLIGFHIRYINSGINAVQDRHEGMMVPFQLLIGGLQIPGASVEFLGPFQHLFLQTFRGTVGFQDGF